jgi:hypothetical protein
MPGEITIAELVRNGTMSAEVAGLLWAAVDEQTSFLTVAVPRFAGKSTTSNAVLALRRPGVPLHPVAGEPEAMERLKRERLGGYLVVAEFSQAPVPGYIWGEPVRRVFDTVGAGYSLQAALHAPSAEAGMREVTLGNRIPDELAATFKLVIYIELFGNDMSNFWRRVAQVYEVDRVEDGRPAGRDLYRWRRDGDRFEAVDAPRQFATDAADVERRAAVLAEMARSGRTGSADIDAAVRDFLATKLA